MDSSAAALQIMIGYFEAGNIAVAPGKFFKLSEGKTRCISEISVRED